MIRNYIKLYESWQDLDPDDVDDIELGTRKPSKAVLNQLFNDIENDNLQGVKDYIALDYDVNVTGSKGERLSPLCYACELGNLDIIKLLLEAGAADVNKKNVVGKTPIFYALKTGKTDYEISNIIEILLNAGADVNAKTPNGSTPLLFSVVNYSNNPTLLSILVKAGADLEAKDKLGITPLMEACLDGYIWNADWLIRNGADVNSKDKDGNTILLLICKYLGHYKHLSDIVKIISDLLDHGAKTNVKDKEGNTPLLYACSKEILPVVDLLIEAGAEVNIKDKEGKTPLDIAISKSNISIVYSLLKAGADVNYKNFNGLYPIEYTTDRRIKDALKEFGAKE